MQTLMGKRVTVVGMGLSGVAAAHLLSQQGAELALTDDRPEHELKDSLKTLNGIQADYHLDGIDEELMLQSDLVIISPGVPSDLPQIERARRAGIEIISEIELAYAFCGAPLIAITGTNGKTTTTMLIHHIMTRAGLRAALAGNIEVPFSRVTREGPLDMVVIEVSSFQLENIKDFKPKAGVLLNISSDHLDRYSGIEEYIEAKAQLFRNQTDADYAVLNKDDPAVAGIADRVRSRILWFSMKGEVEQGAYLCGETLVTRFEGSENEVMHTGGIPLFGRHNIENVLAALAATLPFGASAECCGRAVGDFSGAEHRLERVRELNGILFVNDSKATNVGALEKALESFANPIVLISGGRGKQSDYPTHRSLVKKKLRGMVVIGEDARRLREALGDIIPTHGADTLPDAVRQATQLARPGDCVLLAPACASFDMFTNYKHRGQVFKEAVEGL